MKCKTMEGKERELPAAIEFNSVLIMLGCVRQDLETRQYEYALQMIEVVERDVDELKQAIVIAKNNP